MLPSRYEKILIFCTSPDRLTRKSEELGGLLELPKCQPFYLKGGQWRGFSEDAERICRTLDEESGISTHSRCKSEQELLSRIITTCPKDAQVNWVCKHTHQLILDGGYESLALLSRTHMQTSATVLKRHEDQQQLISTLTDGLDIGRREVRLLDFSPSRVTATSKQALEEHFPGSGNSRELVILIHSSHTFRTPEAFDQFLRVIGQRHVMILMHSAPTEEDWMSLRLLACGPMPYTAA